MSLMTVPLVRNPDGTWTSPSPAWAHLITRESGGNPAIIQQIVDVNSGGNEAEGLFQITPRTWRGANGTDFAPSARSATPEQQAIVAARIFTANPSGGDWGAGRPGREDAAQLAAGLVPLGPPPPPGPLDLLAAARPNFNEFGDWCDNNQDRAGTTIDLWLVHTQEPGTLTDNDAALHLAQFCKSTTGTGNPVAYHYAGRQASDGGVTVVDMVDTDLASWSVGNSNNRAINFCFAGSSSNWSRADWLTQSKAIDVAAFLAVQDAIKYPGLQIVGPGGATLRVIPPPYAFDPPGVSDHRYCTQHLRDGNNHTDVGDNFLWDVFAAAVGKYWATAFFPSGPVPPPPDPPGPTPADPVAAFQAWLNTASDHDLLKYIAAQLGPGDPTWADAGQTVRDFIWSHFIEANPPADPPADPPTQ